jgi:SPX domain protein involved in polyphosphate accumulation
MSIPVSKILRVLEKELDEVMINAKKIKDKYHHQLTQIGGMEQFVEAERQLLNSNVRIKILAEQLEGKEQNEFNQIQYEQE